MDNNSKKGLIEIIDDTEGHEPYKKQINFMSKHPERYKKLKTEACIAKIKAIESSINQLEMKYIPENKIASAKTEINNGDLIAITTSIEGLDVMHNGIAIFKDDELHLIHASTVNNKVEISNVPLSEMIKQNQYMTGIMVSRLK